LELLPEAVETADWLLRVGMAAVDDDAVGIETGIDTEIDPLLKLDLVVEALPLELEAVGMGRIELNRESDGISPVPEAAEELPLAVETAEAE
jgi:hypothetical protein